MGFRLKNTYQRTEEGLELKLQRFMTMILLSENQLNLFVDKITEYRALQMDGEIIYNKETNEKMDMMEDYIADRFLILQDMTEKVLYAKQALLAQHEEDTVSFLLP